MKKNYLDRWWFLTFLLPSLGEEKKVLRLLTGVFNYELHHSKA